MNRKQEILALQNVRSDLSKSLVHFTKATSVCTAHENLCSILKEGSLKGSNQNIKGGLECVCFTESPLPQLAKLFFADTNHVVPYSPFGVGVSKDWLFRRGARNVIYQPESEFDYSSYWHRWRHVTHDPPIVDLAWEREWRYRLREGELQIAPSQWFVVVPSWTDGYESQQPRWLPIGGKRWATVALRSFLAE